MFLIFTLNGRSGKTPNPLELEAYRKNRNQRVFYFLIPWHLFYVFIHSHPDGICALRVQHMKNEDVPVGHCVSPSCCKSKHKLLSNFGHCRHIDTNICTLYLSFTFSILNVWQTDISVCSHRTCRQAREKRVIKNI